MRVLMLAQSYPPIGGGEEHVVEALAIELMRHFSANAVVPRFEQLHLNRVERVERSRA